MARSGRTKCPETWVRDAMLAGSDALGHTHDQIGPDPEMKWAM